MLLRDCRFSVFIYSWIAKKKNEEISEAKLSLHNLFYLIKWQYNMLQEFPPIDTPKELFIQYITTAYELKSNWQICCAIRNLLTTWELDTIKQLTIYNHIGSKYRYK